MTIAHASRTSSRARVLVAFAALGTWWGAWGALVPAIQAHADVTEGELGAAMLFVGVGALASMRAAGTWMDRRGEVLLPGAVAALGLVGILPGLAHGMVALAAALAAVGAASGALDVAINTASVRVEEATARPLMNLAHGCFSVGVIVAALAGGAARAAELPPAAILAVVGAVLLGAARWLHPFHGVSAATAAEPPARGVRWWRVPWRLAAIGVLVALAFFVESAWQSWSALHLERDLDATPFVGALGPAVFAIAAASGRLLGHAVEVHHPGLSLAVVGSLLAAVGSLVGGLAPVPWASLVGVAAAGVGTAVLAPTLLRTAGLTGDASVRGAAVGSVITIGYLGFVVGPAVIGGVATVTTLPVALAGVGVAGVVLAVASPRAG